MHTSDIFVYFSYISTNHRSISHERHKNQQSANQIQTKRKTEESTKENQETEKIENFSEESYRKNP